MDFYNSTTANQEFDVALEKLKRERAEAHRKTGNANWLNFMGWVDDWWEEGNEKTGGCVVREDGVRWQNQYWNAERSRKIMEETSRNEGEECEEEIEGEESAEEADNGDEESARGMVLLSGQSDADLGNWPSEPVTP